MSREHKVTKEDYTSFLEWTNEDVLEWVSKEMGFEQYLESFRLHGITGKDLYDLTEDNLKYDLQVIKLHDRKQILRAICSLMKLYLAQIEADHLQHFDDDKNAHKNHLRKPSENISEGEKEDGVFKVMYEGDNSFNWGFKLYENLRVVDILNETSKYFNRQEDQYFLADEQGFIVPESIKVIEAINNASKSRKNTSKTPLFFLRRIRKKIEEEYIYESEPLRIQNQSSTIKPLEMTHTEERDHIKRQSINPVKHPNELPIRENNCFNNLAREAQEEKKNRDHKENEIVFKRMFRESPIPLSNYQTPGYVLCNNTSSITETIQKESNSSMLMRKRLEQGLVREDEKVTINSFYNIENLNNFNDKSSFESNSQKKNGKKAKISHVNLRSKKRIDFEEMSDDDVEHNPSLYTFQVVKPAYTSQCQSQTTQPILHHFQTHVQKDHFAGSTSTKEMNKMVLNQEIPTEINFRSHSNNQKGDISFSKEHYNPVSHFDNLPANAKNVAIINAYNDLNVNPESHSSSQFHSIKTRVNTRESSHGGLVGLSNRDQGIYGLSTPTDKHKLIVDSRLKSYIDETKKYKNTTKQNNKNIQSSNDNDPSLLQSLSNY